MAKRLPEMTVQMIQALTPGPRHDFVGFSFEVCIFASSQKNICRESGPGNILWSCATICVLTLPTPDSSPTQDSRRALTWNNYYTFSHPLLAVIPFSNTDVPVFASGEISTNYIRPKSHLLVFSESRRSTAGYSALGGFRPGR
jgi:hypothetical protein